VHAVALATVLAMTAILFMPLAAIGEPPFLALMRTFKEAGHDAFAQMDDQANLRDQLYATAWLVPAGIMAVGFPLHRTLREALTRVGLVLPSLGHVVFALLTAGVLVVAMTVFDIATSWVWKYFGWPTTDAKQFEELMKFAISPIGAAVIGVSAG